MTVAELQKKYLPNASPVLSAGDFFVLLAFVSGQERAFLFAHPEYSLGTEETMRLESLLARRMEAEPIAYIMGSKEFYGRRFAVSPAVLIPRPETELLVEEALKEIRSASHEEKRSVIDVGTGSGAIIITLAKELDERNISYFATDISADTLTQAEKNALALDAANISFLRGDLLTPYWQADIASDRLFIVANLPYLPTEMHAEAMADVREYEPALALVSGTDGLDHYRRLIADLAEKTATKKIPACTLFLEIDPGQKETLESLLLQAWPASEIRIVPDLSGKERHLICRIR